MPADLIEVVRNGPQGLIEAERHVPGLGSEDREDRRAFRAQLAAGKQPQEQGDGEGQETQHRHRLEDVERGDDDELGLSAFRREGRKDEGEEQRRQNGGEHPQRRTQRIYRQLCGVERDRCDIELGQRISHPARGIGKRDERRRDDDECDKVEKIRHPPVLAKAEG